MTQNTLTTHVQKAQEALKALLKKLIGSEVPLEASEPQAVPEDRPDGALHDEVAPRFSLRAAEQEVVIALDLAWVPLLSEAMLGEAVEADSEAAVDLMQEIASQGFGTVQSTLAAEGLELSSVQFEAAPPGQAEGGLEEGTFWHVSFSARHEDSELEGFALLPNPDEDAASADTSSQGQQGESSTQQAPNQQSATSQDTAGEQTSEVDVAPAAFSELGDEDLGSNGDDPSNFELLAEVNLEVRVELGRRELPLADVLKLTTGSVVELEKMVGEPLSVYANGRLIAEGEAVVIDEQFGVRITNLASEGRREKAFF